MQMRIQDDVRNSVVHLVTEQTRDGENEGGHSRKSLGYSFEKLASIKGMDGVEISSQK